MDGIPITVRDARDGRDPNLDTPASGQILETYHSPRPLEIGARLTLAGGDIVQVSGFRIAAGPHGTGVTQTVHVKDI